MKLIADQGKSEMEATTSHDVSSLLRILQGVCDPEIPALSVVDLGIVRTIQFNGANVTVTITPTYSGCPAMRMIEEDIRTALQENGVMNLTIKTVFSPAWTTDWLTDDTRSRLREYGIAPPMRVQPELLQIEIPKVECPYCFSHNTQRKSEFGSTACKSFYYCLACCQPFEYLKPL